MSTDGRSKLIEAAEYLFAESGIDGPSLREIARTAGQQNTSAVQYHFGDRDKLLKAVLSKHVGDIERRRHSILDHQELAQRSETMDLAAALVLPAVAKLDDAAGGPEYLQIVSEIVFRPSRFTGILVPSRGDSSILRWSRLVEPFLPAGAVGRPLHRRFTAIRFMHAELASRARRKQQGDHRLFIYHLIDIIAAILSAPLSESTAKLLQPIEDSHQNGGQHTE